VHRQAYKNAQNERRNCPGCSKSNSGTRLNPIELDLKMRVNLTLRPIPHGAPKQNERFFHASYLFPAEGTRMDVAGRGTRTRAQYPLGNLFGSEMRFHFRIPIRSRTACSARNK
jgi:hypothetical protein